MLPEYGPLEIDSLEDFLLKSKERFAENFQAGSFERDPDWRELESLKVIGTGAFGTVLLMRRVMGNRRESSSSWDSGVGGEELFAAKAVDKKQIVRTKQVHHVRNEKKVLGVIDFPFLIHMYSFHMDNSYLYFVLPFIAGGDMFTFLKRERRLDEGVARFYAAQVVLALEYLHYLDLIYRDLKPENVLMDHTGYVKLTDFGFCKTLKTRTWTLCGTPEYLAPEIVSNRGYSNSVDWWALGVFVFEMLAGRSPFYAKDPIKIYERILACRYFFPPYVSAEAKNLIHNLLQPTISLRYGSLRGGVRDIKDHLWFRPVEWGLMLNRKVDPPYIPDCSRPENNFGNYGDVVLRVSDKEEYAKEFESF